jgi:hypothetical protein
MHMKFHRFNPGTVLLGLGLSLAISGCGNGGSSTPNVIPIAVQVGPAGTKFIQIERLARPAVKEVFEPFVQHTLSNHAEPYDTANDPLKGNIKALEDAVRAPIGNNDYGATLSTLLIPDEYAVDLSQTTQNFLGVETTPGGANFGGRNPNEDVIDVELGVIFGNTLSVLGVLPDDGEENACLSKQNIAQNPSQVTGPAFPYFAAPH